MRNTKDTEISTEHLSLPARLQVLKNDLTETELKAGNYFLKNQDAVYKSITEIVELSGLGYGSIIRFCQKIGCAGFQDFKVLLAQGMGAHQAESNGNQKDSIARRAEKLRQELTETEKLINREAVAQAAETLNQARHVLVTGIAGSEATAIGFDYRLSRLGIFSMAVCEGYTLNIRAASLTDKDVLLAISFSGATKEVLSAAAVARKRQATVVSLTNFIHAPLVELADYSLFSATDRDPLSCEIFSTVSSHFVLDVLFEELFRIRKDARETVDRTYRAIADRRV